MQIPYQEIKIDLSNSEEAAHCDSVVTHRVTVMARLTFRGVSGYDYNRNVTALAMDNRFLLVGQKHGQVSAHFLNNSRGAFNKKICEADICAVCCEEQDENWNEVFYVCDADNNVFTLNKRGDIVAKNHLGLKKGKIHTIDNFKKFSFTAHTSLGEQPFTKELFRFRYVRSDVKLIFPHIHKRRKGGGDK